MSSNDIDISGLGESQMAVFLTSEAWKNSYNHILID